MIVCEVIGMVVGLMYYLGTNGHYYVPVNVPFAIIAAILGIPAFKLGRGATDPHFRKLRIFALAFTITFLAIAVVMFIKYADYYF